MSHADLLQVPKKFIRSATVDRAWARDSALWQIRFVCDQLGIDDLSDTEVLDMGCGVKLTKAILDERLPIKRYVGLDVYGEMIEFLQKNVADQRFEFRHVDLHNELYNPTGEPMLSSTRLPVPEASFDLILLFSVFTHLNPVDFHAMLQVLRPYSRDTGRLLFSLYLDEVSESGHGFRDAAERRLADEPGSAEWKEERFADVFPEFPLRVALYSREYAEELVAGTGWRLLAVNDPGPFVQHTMLCEPA